LVEAVSRAERGLVDADLGGHLIKQRVARKGEGRRGGYRVVIALQAANRAIFMQGFAKNDLGNISSKELEDLKKLAANWLAASDAAIQQALDQSILVEVKHEKESK
jgi:hypothetical protein